MYAFREAQHGLCTQLSWLSACLMRVSGLKASAAENRAHACKHSVQEVEKRGPEAQGQAHLHKLQDALGYRRSDLKRRRKTLSSKIGVCLLL